MCHILLHTLVQCDIGYDTTDGRLQCMMCYCDRLSAGMCEEEHSILRACLYVNPDHLTEQVST